MLTRILLPLLFLLWLPLWGIDRWWLRAHLSRKMRRGLSLLPLLLSLLAIATAFHESYTAAADRWKGILIPLLLLVIVPTVLFAVGLLLGRLPARRHPGVAKGIAGIGAAAGIAAFCALLYGFTLGYRHITVRPFAYHHPALPAAFDGYRIVQLSDLHLGTLAHHRQVVEHIVDSVNACHPDLVVFTGDLVNYHSSELDGFVDILRRLQAPDGVVSVMGNHDYAQYYHWASPADSIGDIRRLQQMERHMGWHLLLNDHHLVYRDDDSLAIVGVENDGRPPFPARGDLPRAQRGLAPDCFRILLSHDPTHWRRHVLPDTDIPLMLAGHTHGMQLKIGHFSPAAWFYPEWGGAYTEDGRTLYVSIGTGEVMIPFRLGAWPEITLITLHRASLAPSRNGGASGPNDDRHRP